MTKGIMWINFKEEAKEHEIKKAVEDFYLRNRNVVSGAEWNEFRDWEAFNQFREQFHEFATDNK